MNAPVEHTRIFERLRTELAPELTYHALDHTLDVYRRAAELAVIEALPQTEIRLLMTAAAYHDAGYLVRIPEHEIASAEMARIDLPEFGYSPEEIDQVCDMIAATRIPQKPQSASAKVLCDADLDYLGRNDYPELAEKLFQEMKQTGNPLDASQWRQTQIDFFNAHAFFTEAARQSRNPGKANNLAQITDPQNTEHAAH